MHYCDKCKWREEEMFHLSYCGHPSLKTDEERFIISWNNAEKGPFECPLRHDNEGKDKGKDI